MNIKVDVETIARREGNLVCQATITLAGPEADALAILFRLGNAIDARALAMIADSDDPSAIFDSACEFGDIADQLRNGIREEYGKEEKESRPTEGGSP